MKLTNRFSCSPPGCQGDRGVTAAEVLAVIFIITLLLAAGVLDYRKLSESMNRGTALKQLEGDFQRARAQAISEGARTIVVLRNEGTEYTVGVDHSPYNTAGTPDRILYTKVLPPNISASFSGQLIFDSRGCLVDLEGELSQATVSIHDAQATYASGTIYAAGFLQLN